MLDPVAMPHIADIPRVQGQKLADKPAIWFEGETTNFAELDRYSSQIANGLIALGVEPDDRVAYLGKNMGAYYEILFGCAKARAAMTGINNRLAPPEMQFILSDSCAKVLFVAQEFYDAATKIAPDCPKLEQIIAIDGEHADWPAYRQWRSGQSPAAPGLKTEGNDDVIQLYTSGTTGLPKGVMLTNDNYRAVFEEAAKLEWSAYDEGDAVMNAMPLFHVAGCNIGVLAAAQGAKTVILREIDPSVILNLVEEHKINHAFWVPAVILMLSQMPGVDERDFSSLKTISYGASPIAEDLLKRAIDLFGARFTQLYGLTETVGLGTYLPHEAHDPSWGKLRSCGVPYPSAVVQVVDAEDKPVPQGAVGEIVIRADFVMKGYWNREEATEEALTGGFFHTGDAGYFDEDGFLYIHDRIKDMIVSGGENVYPAEVENAIFGHPDLADVAVIGVPSEKWGEEVKAIVVCKEGHDCDAASVIAWARERIAGYKCPKSVDFVPALPRNPSGKILRKDLRAPHWDGHERQIG
ncbi:long-chain-fatty-acid--CoA ligase [Henriciella litoralis]|uniref:long-chain-fatty-acid--CoA ligase n=1 Tax=Henriciella litoralis TaxID=568102 RepID=UPI000A029694|nr:long-chain-fatty-acid--CoA ligase [Henriciella litoralis]